MSSMPNRVLNPVLSLVLLAGVLVAVSRPSGSSVPPSALRPASFTGAIGEKNVDAFGAYRRELPLRVPSFHGIQPALRLVYSSRAGNGLTGAGWTLTGLPEITRRSPNLGAPAFDATDVFQLDGAELVACTPAMTDPSCRLPAAPGQRAFAARSADYRRIALDQGRWLVWERGGALHVFVEEPHPGTEPTAWALATTTDPEGHQVSYSRNQNPAGPDTASYPDTITYGGVTIRFHYQDRDDTVSHGDGRDLVLMRRRLRTVDVIANGSRVRLYRLSYDVNKTTGQSFLSGFEEFGANAVTDKSGEVTNPLTARPLPATTFVAQPAPKQEWSSAELPGLAGLPVDGGPRPTVLNGMAFTVSKPHLLNAPPNLGDVDGNGRTDWVQATPDLDYNSAGDPIHTTLLITAALAGRTAPIHTQTTLGFPFAGIMHRTYLSDVDADGRADLVFLLLGDLIPNTDPYMDFRSLSMVVARSVGDGSFAWLSTAADLTPFMTRAKSTYRKAKCAPGDIDGDRRADLLCSYTDDANRHHLGIARSNGDGTWTFSDTFMDFPDGDGTRDLAVGDTNGDRFADAMFLDYPACPPTGPCDVNYILTTAVSDGFGGHNIERTPTDWAWGTPTFFAADVNGDRRADYVLFASVDELSTDPGAIQTALTNASGGYTLQSQEVAVVLRQIQHSVAVGDFDGDMRADLMVVSQQRAGVAGCGTSVSYTHLNLHRVRSFGDGTFDLPSTWEDCAKSVELSVPWTDMRYTPVEPEAADLDGDGADDFVIAESPSGTDVTTLHENLSGNPDADTHAWRTGEFNGDGRADWVYFRNTPTGPLLYTMLSNASGGFTGHGYSPRAGTHQLTAQAGWQISDINADGLDDVLHLRYDDIKPGLEVSSWIAQGNGSWAFRKEIAHAGLTGPHRDITAWRVADLNADGRGDLVYADRDDTTGALKIWTSLSNGDGTWSDGTAPPTGTWPGPDGAAWRVADLNGDGRHDLTHIGMVAGTVEVRSLLSLGNGQFSPTMPATVSGPDLAGLPLEDLAGWSVGEVNGDGLGDLIHLSQTSRTVGQPTQVLVLNLLGHGNGQFTPRRDEPMGTYVGDLSQWRPATVSADGRTDMVHVRNDGGSLTVTALRPFMGGRWTLMPPQGLPTPAGTVAGGFASADADGDGETDLVRFDLTQPGMRALTIKAGAARDIIARVGLTTGGTEEIDYAVPHSTGGGVTCALPSGVAPLAVSALRQSSGPGMAAGRAGFHYTCPRWSQRQRTLMGWEYITSLDGSTYHHPGFNTMRRYDLTDACGARLALEASHDPQGNFLRKEITQYKHTGAAAPYTCLVDAINRVTAGASTSLNSTTGFIYDGFGNLTRVLENGGGNTARTTHLSYAPLTASWIVDRPWQITVYDEDRPGGTLRRSIFHCYDGNNGTDQVNCSSNMSMGRLTAIKLVNANGWYDTTTYAYDTYGNIGAVTDADNRTTTIDYDPVHRRFPVSVCDALNHCTGLEWNYGIEKVSATVDANTARTDYGYDPYGRLNRVTSPTGSRTITRLDEGNPQLQRLRVVQADGTTDGLWNESYFDGLGRLWQEKAEGPTAGDPRMRTIGYDDASPYPARRGHWHFASAAAVFEGLSYDGAGRPAGQTHPDGTGLRWDYAASLAGTTTKFTDEVNMSTMRAFDGYDRIKSAQADPGGPAAGATLFATNAVDELHTITDPLGNPVVEQIDPRGDVVARTDPDRGDFTALFDRTGHVKQVFPQSGGVINTYYDTVGRKKMAELASYRTINWLYDEPGHGNSIGRLTAITDTNGIGCPFRNGVPGGWVVDERTYDLAGRVTSNTLCVEGESKTFGFAYDAMGRQRSITYPDGEIVIYRYNDAGQLRRIDGYVKDILYDAAGRITNISYDNGTTETFTYHPLREWLETHTINQGKTVLSSTEYHYYNNGQLHWQSTTGTGAGRSNYFYDSAGRLTLVTGAGAADYDYNAAGDMTLGPDGGYSYTHPDPAKNRCGGTGGNTCPHAVKTVGAATELTYNLRGEVTQITRTTGGVTTKHDIGWNADGEPTTFGANGTLVATVQYGVDGERTSVASGTQKTRFFGGYLEVIRPTPGAPAQETKSYYAGALALAQRGAGGLTFNHHDTLGSTTLVTTSGGAVQAGYTYDAYGKLIGATGSGGDRRYAGHKAVELGLIDMGARLYDPQIGRFLSPDPKRHDAREPRPVDPFSYANGDPVNLIDPKGFQATRNFAFGALGSGVMPGSQPSQAELDAINTWLGRPDPSTEMPAPLHDTGISRNGGACSMCHGRGDYFVTREPTTGEKIAFGIVIGAAVIVLVVVLAPEIAAGAAAVEAAVTAVDAVILRASIWVWAHAQRLGALVLGIMREGVSSGGGFGDEAEIIVEEVERMRLDFEIWEGDEMIENGTMYSGPGGVWGHGETRWVEEYMGTLGPQHDVILQGQHNMCSYGMCRSSLNDMAIMDGPNIFYWGHGFERGPQLQTFVSGVGFVYAPR